jgi:ABC-type multidrug transport system fused ATPase/permease subunit
LADNAKGMPRGITPTTEVNGRMRSHEFIKQVAVVDYDQQLGREFDNEEELSGGQWQKLAIARAFYNKPPVLILNEPTSAVDAEAEYEIFNTLEQEYQDKTLGGRRKDLKIDPPRSATG